MATGPSYRVGFRRRREGKTDYQQRRSLILSGLPRLVIRGSLKGILVELIKAEVGGDKVIVSANSNELAKNYGWQGGRGSLPAAYLTGLLCGFKATTKGLKKAVLDLGLHAPTKSSRVFAALKGVLDTGVIVPYDEDKLPDEKRIQGQHISEYARQLASNPDVYQKRFAEQLSRGLRPEEITEHFSQVKQKISSSMQKKEVPAVGEEEKTAKPLMKKHNESEEMEEKE